LINTLIFFLPFFFFVFFISHSFGFLFCIYTNCGRTVERRLQILITSLRPEACAFSAFFNRYPSTNGPFQTERATINL